MQRTVVRGLVGASLTALALLWGCSEDGGDATGPDDTIPPVDDTTDARAAFPMGITVASPLSPTGGTFRGESTGLSYFTAVEWITRILDGRVEASQSVDGYRFFTLPYDAPCYGPQLGYEDHPDGDDGSPPFGSDHPLLPGGDLGIWRETTDSGQACAAAQLNARMQDIENQGSAALSFVAAMVQAYSSTGATWPDDVEVASTVDLTEPLDDLGIAGVAITQASMTRDVNGRTWRYSLEMEVDDLGDDRTVFVDLAHYADPETGLFEGILTWSVEDELYPPGNCGSTEMTRNGSMHYRLAAEGDLRLQARQAIFCGHGPAGYHASVDSDVLSGSAIDPSSSWANTFTVFTGEFDPETLAGRFTYVWQAGPGDSHSRILMVGLDAGAETGEAYFGYGHSVETTDGSVQGFICNWAGPGNSHALQPYAQRQHMTKDVTSGFYVPTNEGASDITYAPTNPCTYDGSGTFRYDRDLDGALDDEDATTVNVGPGEALELDLMGQGQSDTLWEAIRARGFDLPAYPE